MAILIAPLLFIGAVLYVAYPLLYDSRQDAPAGRTRSQREDLEHQKEEIIENLKDIDMDFRMGKLSARDYQLLKGDFEQRAVEVFQRLEALEEADAGSGNDS